MATVSLTTLFGNIDKWSGTMFEANASTVFVTKTANSAVIRYGSGHDFENYTVTFTGRGFTYAGDTVTGGVLTSAIVKNESGQTVVSISAISSSTVASDFASLMAQVMGTVFPDGNTNRDGKAAWSQLLSGNDRIIGATGEDRQMTGSDLGNDVYEMRGGDDFFAGGAGNDIYRGGNGYDTLNYTETTFNEGNFAFRGANVNLVTNKALDPWGGTDTLNSVEEVRGSRFADVFLGNAADNEFRGMAGADRIDGGGSRDDKIKYGDDHFFGGNRGIKANLTTGKIVDGFGQTDTVKNVEWVLGTRYDDSFIGSAGRDVFIGDAGVDTYDGRGNNLADSGESDRIQFNWTFSDQNQTGIVVDLSLASGQIVNDGYGNTENTVNVEGIIGSNQDDIISGNARNNLFAGADGRDEMSGGSGRDEFVWWDINHFNDGDRITDFLANQDKLSFDQSSFGGMNRVRIENDLNPNTAQGTFLFDNASDILYWDANGSGAGQRYAIVELPNVNSLSFSNFELY
jgi:serralysin